MTPRDHQILSDINAPVVALALNSTIVILLCLFVEQP